MEPEAARGEARPPARAGLRSWLREGLRASVLRAPRQDQPAPTPWELTTLMAIALAVQVAVSRFEVEGAAALNYRVWLASLWPMLGVLFIAWCLHARMPAGDAVGTRHPIARWLALMQPAGLPAVVAGAAVATLVARGVWPEGQWLHIAAYAALTLWSAAIVYVCTRTFLPPRRAAVLVAVALGLGVASQWLFPQRLWYSTEPAAEGDGKPQLTLSQEVFEQQQALWRQGVEGLAPQRPGRVDLYAIVFAPYADEDVFLRESTLVAGVLASRFNAAGRTLHLVNHASTAGSHPWATPANLDRAVSAIAAKMDLEEDVLLVYLTSHGGKDFKLAASHWPLEVGPAQPGELKAQLDKAAVRNRVVIVSACYSGGWIERLAGESTLVMTAADSTHTSYGCGRLSELTYFGRALFDEQLRGTRSFEQAFAQAVPVIRKREDEAGKRDGFSNPQISVGPRIRPVLQALEQGLEKGS